jgi:3-oxoacyl-[acyl-carrier-protein] synthase II
VSESIDKTKLCGETAIKPVDLEDPLNRVKQHTRRRRVVITGLGVVAPNGIGKVEFWEANVKGRSGVDFIKSFDTRDFQTKIGAEINDFDPLEFMSKSTIHHTDRFSQFAIACSKMAYEDSTLDLHQEDSDRMGVIIGTGLGGMFFYEKHILMMQEYGPKKVPPGSVPRIMANAPASQVAIELNLKGPNLTIATACASGGHAIGQAFELILQDKADIIFAGGTEAPFIRYTYAGFDALRVMSKRNDSPKKASRPFDKERDGFVMGEGAGILILEELDHALNRGTRVYAEIIGYSANSGAFHMVIPVKEGRDAAKAMAEALKEAKVSPKDVDYINAHGTSTIANDKAETQAIKEAFGDYAYKIPISSTKSMIGHTIGASGAFGAIVCALTIESNVVPPTINYKCPDPECDLDYVPNEARRKKVDIALSNCFGFGSNNATLVFRRFG